MQSPGKRVRTVSAWQIARILVAEGEVSEADVNEALSKKDREEKGLGEVLVSGGKISPEALSRIISWHIGTEYVVLSEAAVDPGLIGIVGEDILHQCEAIPLRIENGNLVVAMKDPDNPESRSCIVESSGHPIVPLAADQEAIRVERRRLLGEGGGSLEGGRGLPRRSARIGEILVSEGGISEKQLDQALRIQKNDPRKLGEILISLGFLAPEDLARALARRLRLDYLAISETPEDQVDPRAIRLLGEQPCRRYKVLPLRLEDDGLVVAMNSPNDLFALEDLRAIAKRPLRPVVATQEDITAALDRLFGPEGENSHQKREGETSYGEPGGNELMVAEGPPAETEHEVAGFEQQPVGERRLRRTLAGSGKIGDVLVSEGKISGEQLQQASQIQENDPKSRPVGEVLLSLGHVTRTDLARALARSLRLEFLELGDEDVDRGLLNLVDHKVLRRHRAVPLRMEDGTLVVAMGDPTNIHALEDLRMISGHSIKPVVATREDIQRTQTRLLALGGGVSEFLEEAALEPVSEDESELVLGADAGTDEAPIIRLVSSILQQAVGDGASDIHIEPQAREVTVRFRVDGVLRKVMSVPQKLQDGITARLKVVANLNIAERRVPQDGRFSVRVTGRKIDLRVATLPTAWGEKVVLRLLDTSNVEADLKKLGFSPEAFERYEEVFRRPYGAILVTGPTGSGKSTTLYATLKELNSPESNIITVEDPVEYRVPGLNQIQVNPKAGLTFASGLRSILRSDPDVIMIGEIRDVETAKISVESALTGHLVLATLHTNDAPGALTRLTEMGVEPFLTSSAVDCVIAQRLGRRLCERCKEPVEIGRDVLDEMGFPYELAPEKGLNFHKAVGCRWCGDSGYRGRVGFYEMMVATAELREMIVRRVSTDEISRAAEESGMVRLRNDGLAKAAGGVTTVEEVLRTVV